MPNIRPYVPGTPPPSDPISTSPAAQNESHEGVPTGLLASKDKTEEIFSAEIRADNALMSSTKHRDAFIAAKVEVFDFNECALGLLEEAKGDLKRFQEPISASIEAMPDEYFATIGVAQEDPEIRVRVQEVEDEALEGTICRDPQDQGLTGRAQRATDLEALGKEIRTDLEKARANKEWWLTAKTVIFIVLGIFAVVLGLGIVCAGAASLDPAAAIACGIAGVLIMGSGAALVGYNWVKLRNDIMGATEEDKHQNLGREDVTIKQQTETIDWIKKMEANLQNSEKRVEVENQMTWLASKNYKIDRSNYTNFVKAYAGYTKKLEEIKKEERMLFREFNVKRARLKLTTLSISERTSLETEQAVTVQKQQANQAKKHSDNLLTLLEAELNGVDIMPIPL